jgi:hypothetical protein
MFPMQDGLLRGTAKISTDFECILCAFRKFQGGHEELKLSVTHKLQIRLMM